MTSSNDICAQSSINIERKPAFDHFLSQPHDTLVMGLCTVEHRVPAVFGELCTRTAGAREGLYLTAPAPWVPPARLYLYHWYGERLTPWVRV